MSRNRRITRLLLTTVLVSAGSASHLRAFAQGTPPVPADQNPAADTDVQDDEEAEEILFEADSVYRDYDDGPIIAEGDVRAFFGERYLRADRLSYNPLTDVAIADGNVSITDADMETVFAGRVELSGDLRDGVAENFSALLEDNARLAAESAVQEQGARTRLNRAVYTACNVCNDDGEAKTPTWRLKSLRVTRDKERKVIRFQHAFLEIKGVPILYVPFLQAPDPSVERQSGFLPPDVGASSRLGFNFELPYYLAISNHQDATFRPRYTANDGILWQGEWRRRGRKGYHVLAGGVIDNNNSQEEEEDVPGVRWHYFGRGYRDFGENWRASYDVERISDDTYLRQYDVEREGDLRQALDRGFTNQLRSNARVAYAGQNTDFSVDTFLFQGLRRADDAQTTPYVLPLINVDHRLPGKYAGGDTVVSASLASLQRTGGIDSRRFTASAFWSRDVITRGGHRFNLFAEARGDVYYFQDLDEGTEICTSATNACASQFAGFSGTETNDFETRLAPSVGVEWSYPLTREFAGGRLFVEPRVQLVASIADQNPLGIVNEDSQSIEFDYAGLFDYNKSTGYDAFEDGQRANVGLTASAEWQRGLSIEGSIGQQFRVQSTDAFDRSTGLGGESSDIVGALNIRYRNIVGVENRFRVEDGFGNVQRAESMFFLRAGPVRSAISYVRLNEENQANNLIKREELTAQANLRLTDHWSIGTAWRRDLELDRTVIQDFIVGYEDECSTFGITYRRDRTRTTNLEPDNAILLTFTLKSLVDQ